MENEEMMMDEEMAIEEEVPMPGDINAMLDELMDMVPSASKEIEAIREKAEEEMPEEDEEMEEDMPLPEEEEMPEGDEMLF